MLCGASSFRRRVVRVCSSVILARRAVHVAEYIKRSADDMFVSLVQMYIIRRIGPTKAVVATTVER